MSVIKIENVTKGYGPLEVLKGLNVEVQRGGVYGFLGLNGSGKTTTMHLLMGLLEAESGTVEVFGNNPLKFSVEDKQKIAYVPEDHVLPEWMTATSIGSFHGSHYPDWSDKDFSSNLDRFEINPDCKISKLSKGGKRKLALSLALSTGAELFLFDEPASGLDPNARVDFIESIAGLFREENKTVLFSTHILNDIEKAADQILILHNGNILINSELDSLRQTITRLHISGDINIPEINKEFNVISPEEKVKQGDFFIKDANQDAIDKFASSSKAIVKTLPFSLEEFFRQVTKKENI